MCCGTKRLTVLEPPHSDGRPVTHRGGRPHVRPKCHALASVAGTLRCYFGGLSGVSWVSRSRNGCHSERPTFDPTVTTANTAPLHPAPHVGTIGDVLTLSCGKCLDPLAGVTVAGVQRQLPPMLRATPAPALVSYLRAFLERSGAVIMCPRCSRAGG